MRLRVTPPEGPLGGSRSTRTSEHHLLSLQRSAGNQAVATMVQRSTREALPRLGSFREWMEVMAGSRLLRRGGAGPAVTSALQGALAGLGHDPGPLDGIWGSLTDTGLRSFQHEHGLVADALIGPKTGSLLEQAQSAGESGAEIGNSGAAGASAIGRTLGGDGSAATIAALASLVGLPSAVAVVAGVLPPFAIDEAAALIGRLRDQADPVINPTEGRSTAGPSVQRLKAANKKTEDAPPGTRHNVAAQLPIKVGPAELGALGKLIDFLMSAFAQMKAAGTLALSAQEIALCEERMARIRSMVNERQQAAVGGAVVDSRAVVAVGLAQGQIGATDSTKGDGVDAADTHVPKRRLRKSRDRVMEYFDVAYGGAGYSRDIVNHITAGKVWDGTYVEGKKHMVDKSDTLQDWCGIFPLWALRSAGFNVGTWVVGSTIGGVSGFNRLELQKGDQVRPGDVGNVSRLQHQYLVVRVHDDGDTLDTVEGNTNSSFGAQGGQVAQHSRRKISTTDVGFFRPADAL